VAVKESGGKTYETAYDFSDVSPYVAVPLVKDFTTLGIVTVTKTVISDNASPVVYKNNPITYADIMAEAAKLKADAVINVVFDLEVETEVTGESLPAVFTGEKAALRQNKKVIVTETYTATALAIKYGATITGNEIAPFGAPGGGPMQQGSAASASGNVKPKRGGLFGLFGNKN
jgi:hypothetical protein